MKVILKKLIKLRLKNLTNILSLNKILLFRFQFLSDYRTDFEYGNLLRHDRHAISAIYLHNDRFVKRPLRKIYYKSQIDK